MKVPCSVEEIDMENEDGYQVDGICVRCSRCEHEAEVFGTSGASIRRGLVMLREECPNEESNFYTADNSEQD